MAQIRTYIRQRASIKSQITRMNNFLNDNIDASVSELEERRNRIIELGKSYEEVQLAIELEDTNSDHEDERENFEKQYFATIGLIRSRIQLAQPNIRDSPSRMVDSPNTLMVKQASTLLPKIEIRPFDGNPIEWHSFHDTFKSLVHESDELPAVQKFHLLKNSLRGEVASVIASLNASEQNYFVAWDLLQQRCNKPRQIIQAHLKLLLELPDITRDSPGSLRSLAEQAQMHVNALKALKEPTQYWDSFLVYIIGQKLDKNTRRAWERTLENNELPKFDQFLTFVNKQARGEELEVGNSNASRINTHDYRLRNKAQNRSQAYVSTNTNKSNACIICKEEHELFFCNKFLQLPVRERFEAVKRANLCFNCLKDNHVTSSCKWGNCRKCGRKHNTLLHYSNEAREKTLAVGATANSSTLTQNVKTTLTVAFDSEILLGTAQIKILDRFNNEHNCRVLLDGGSQTHFITKEFAERLQLDKQMIDLSFSGLGQLNTRAEYYIATTIKSRNSSFSSNVTFIALPSITGLLPSRQIDRSTITIPNNIKLADPNFHKPGKIDALLGSTLFYQLLSTGQIKPNNNTSVIIQKTQLGWIVVGESNIQSVLSPTRHIKSCHVATASLEKQLHRFWEIEELPSQQYMSPDERACEEHFKLHTQRESDGRFVVRLPFNSKTVLLGESKKMALKRFYALERKLHANPNLLEQYKEFLNEYQRLGHMSKISIDQDNEGFYLPHHAVVKESSATTKVRVVFDASAKSSTGIALNDTLLTGPTIQNSLHNILLRFRVHTYVMTADIEKMYRQIKIHPEDQIYQKILWRDSMDKPINTFRLNTVTYGTASAPFLAIRCLHQIAKDEKQSFPAAARVIEQDFYVDDLLTGASTVEAAIKLKNELITLAQSGGFHLRQWSSNNQSIITDLANEDHNRTLCLDPYETQKTLGIFWKPSCDHILYTVKPFDIKARVTKRIILSQVSQLFDPLGLLGPVIIKAKIILQQLWKTNVSWDESVPQHIHHSWKEFKDELSILNHFKTPRRAICDHASELELHGFCDASETAYGACMYIRSTDFHSNHQVNLLCAKSRVAPIKQLTIPRLELCAAKLLIQLYKEVRSSLNNIQFKKIRFWSDSTIVLHWIKTPPHLLKTFVANRVSEIQAESEVENWAHVTTSDNPADFISRGQLPGQFIKNQQWLTGPQWLSQNENNWPVTNIMNIEIPEKRQVVSLKAVVDNSSLYTRYSSINKLNRVLAYTLRFIKNCKNKERITGELTAQEVYKAHLHIIKQVQAEVFNKEIKDFTGKGSLNGKSTLLSLNPFIDENGILRVGGRLEHASISYSRKHPIILPRDHHVTNLIIQDAHVRQWHAGTQATLNAVRQRYWPISGKGTTKRIIHRCIRCYRANPKIPMYTMGNLPSGRVTQARPFQNVGIDYCGHFFIKEKKHRNRNKVKCYVVVFVCFATKATHLELVTDLTTEAFIAALKRFFARRGRAQNIYTDNGSNFVGAKNEILELQSFLKSNEHQHQVQRYLSNENIQWHFSPPRSPHFGGLWEASVKVFKRHLYRTVGNELFTYEQFNTFLVEIEAIMNSRPLLPVSTDPNDLSALTPAHFLIGDSLSTLPEHQFTDIPSNRLSVWQHVQRVKQHFWSRWHHEYLHELHTRSKWHIGNDINIKEGMLVIIREDNSPPLHWKLGRIIAIHPGEDNIIRVATVRTACGTYKRSIKKLSPLPIDIHS